MTYHFPRAKFADTNTIPEQITAIAKEIAELCKASWGREGDERIIEECMDVIHAAETLLWIAEATYGPRQIEIMKCAIIEKNRKRGYYE